MLQKIRDHASGWFAYIIFGMLIIPFGLWGIDHYIHQGSGVYAAQVNGDEISLRDFQNSLQQQRSFLLNLNKEVDDASLKLKTMEQLINERLLRQYSKKENIFVTDEQLLNRIKSIDAFRSDNGNFDVHLFDLALQRQGYTQSSFMEMLKKSLPVEQFANAFDATALFTREDLGGAVRLLAQKRSVEIFNFLHSPVFNLQYPSDADLNVFFEKNKSRFNNPEMVKINYINLDLNALLDKQSVSEQELLDAYKQQLSIIGTPEQRVASYILVRVPENANENELKKAEQQATALYERLKSGKSSFDKLGDELQHSADKTIEFGTLGSLRPGVMEPAFDQALFSLAKVGDISAPVHTSFGFQLIKLDKIYPKVIPDFENVRSTLEKQLAYQKAETQFFDVTDRLATLVFENPDDLDAVATKIGVPVEHSDWFSINGNNGGVFSNQKVINAAFSDDVLLNGKNSEPIQIGDRHVLVLRVVNHKKQTPKTFDEARLELISSVKNEMAKNYLKKEAGNLEKMLFDGADVTSIIEAYGKTVEHQRLDEIARNFTGLNNSIVESIFKMPVSDEKNVAIKSIELTNGNWVVIKLLKVTNGNAENLSENDRKAWTDTLTKQISDVQMTGFINELRGAAKIINNIDRL